MGRQPCCDKVGLKKGPWTADEDHKLVAFIATYGYGCWREVPKRAGLLRCGKSCRLRWTNYLRPDLKRGMLSEAEEDLIIRLHAAIGNRWSRIAAQLPGRTDNEIKNYWNTRIKKKLKQLGIDPVTHRPLAACTPSSYHLCNESSALVPAIGARNQVQIAKDHSKFTGPTTTEPFTAVKIESEWQTYVGWNSNPSFEHTQRGVEGTSTQKHVFDNLLLQTLEPTKTPVSPISGTSFPSRTSCQSRKSKSDEDSDDSVCTREFVDLKPNSRRRQLPPYNQQNSSPTTLFDEKACVISPTWGNAILSENSICLQKSIRDTGDPLPSAVDNPKLSSLTLEASFSGPYTSNLVEFSQPQSSPDLCSTAEHPTLWNDSADGWNTLDYQLMNHLYESASPSAVITHYGAPVSWTTQLSDCFWSETSPLL